MIPTLLEWASEVVLRVAGRTGAILCLHGVNSSDAPSQGTLHVARNQFVATLALLKEAYSIVHVDEIVRRHRDGRDTRGLLAITFDDAYATVLAVQDVLEQEHIPITIFPVGDAVVAGSRFWWDRIDELFPHLQQERWGRFEAVCGVPEEYYRGQPVSFGPLRPLRQWILANFQGRWPESLAPYLEELESEAGRSTTQRSMTLGEIEQLAGRVPVQVGVHTLSHPVLPLLPDAEVRHEIAECFDLITERCTNAVPILAVPYGLADERTVRLAGTVGMISSLSLRGRLLRTGTAPEWLPRFCLSNGIPTWKLKLRLAGAIGGMAAPWSGETTEYPDLPSATA